MAFFKLTFRITEAATHHRFNFLVKEGYLVLARESIGGRYLGKTCSQNKSGRKITNDRPCGSHETISVKAESSSISKSFCGKISFFLEFLL